MSCISKSLNNVTIALFGGDYTSDYLVLSINFKNSTIHNKSLRSYNYNLKNITINETANKIDSKILIKTMYFGYNYHCIRDRDTNNKYIIMVGGTGNEKGIAILNVNSSRLTIKQNV